MPAPSVSQVGSLLRGSFRLSPKEGFSAYEEATEYHLCIILSHDSELGSKLHLHVGVVGDELADNRRPGQVKVPLYEMSVEY